MKKVCYYIFLAILLILSLLVYFECKNEFLSDFAKTTVAKSEDVIAIIQNKIYPTSDIDLVYTWVDGNDKEWQKEKEFWAKKYGVEYNRANDVSRFIDNDELKYSLRSVEKNAPWVNKIYIVTNGQIPKWLNTNHPKIKIITHEQIMPKDSLPTFNSMAIEANIANIPELSEKFLYANDDTFFGRPLTPDYFYTKDEKLKVLERKRWEEHYDKDFSYYASIQNAIDLINTKYKMYPYLIELNHGISSYFKSYFLKCEKEFQEEFKKTTYSKFRKSDNINRHIVSFYTIENKKAILRKKNISDGIMIMLDRIGLAKKIIERNHIKQFCLNDTDKATMENRLKLKEVMQEFWPEKSSFEK